MFEQKTLKEETIEDLKEYGKSVEDVKCVCGNDFQIPVDLFWKLADVKYDKGFGAQEVATDLKLYGDDFWMERHEYDGSEWWEFKQMIVPKDLPMRDDIHALVVEQSGFGSCGWRTLICLNDEKYKGHKYDDEDDNAGIEG